MRGTAVYARTLQRAAEVLGSKSNLREFLRVSIHDLDAWLDGGAKPPTEVFLKAVDIVSAAPSAEVQRARNLRREAETLRAKAAAAQARAQATLKAILEKGLVPAPQPVITALAFLEREFEPPEGAEMIEAALDAAIGATGANRGNIQLAQPAGLRVVAQRGFEEPFVDFCPTLCDIARKIGRRVSIADVRADPLLSGTADADALAAAGVRAVQSTPLLGSSDVLGMLSTHYASPHDLTAPEEDMLDQIAKRTAFWLDGGFVLQTATKYLSPC